MRLIDAELTAKDIARYKVVALERGNDKMNKMMECYINPTAFSDGVSYGMELAQKVVCGQPTAYDIDKVVEQLEEKIAECKKAFEYAIDTRSRDECIALRSLRGGYEEAVEIVKKGGNV